MAFPAQTLGATTILHKTFCPAVSLTWYQILSYLMFLLLWLNTITKATWRERIVSSYSLSIIQGSQGRSLEFGGWLRNHGRVLPVGLLPIICSACLLTTWRTTSAQENAPQICPQADQSGVGIFSIEVPSSKMTLTFVKLTLKTSQCS